MANIVAGDMYMKLDGQLHEIKNQIRLRGGYPYNLEQLSRALQRVIEGNFDDKVVSEVEVCGRTTEPRVLPDLTSTGPTFADWLVAREKLHLFLTGETVVLRDMFSIPPELLARKDIMPAFRPAGATNRLALDWKLQLGMNVPYEEVDVMKYNNAQGPKIPKLWYINRSEKPDEDTLGDKAMSPDSLIAVPNLKWLQLFGYSDADNLHYFITRSHLDSEETWTWFPEDRFHVDGQVARGGWRGVRTRAHFRREYCFYCSPRIGARVAISLSLKLDTRFFEELR